VNRLGSTFKMDSLFDVLKNEKKKTDDSCNGNVENERNV
jgi:hypothetical protein